jgi:hypothetical protein
MTDDIVTRLRGQACPECGLPSTHNQFDDAADEIERLRTIIQDIANAVTDEGRKPGYHKQQVNYVRTMWNPLYKAISKAVKEEKKWTQEQ